MNSQILCPGIYTLNPSFLERQASQGRHVDPRVIGRLSLVACPSVQMSRRNWWCRPSTASWSSRVSLRCNC